MTNPKKYGIIESERGKENPNKPERATQMKKTSGWYTFKDGYSAWYSGLTGTEKKWEIYKHGPIVKFIPD